MSNHLRNTRRQPVEQVPQAPNEEDGKTYYAFCSF